MSKISVSVTDGTNVNLTVSPRPVQTITVSRGSTGTGTVTAVTANTPLSVTNGTTTPDLSIAQATTSTAGYVSSTDWNTFNNKIGTITSSDNSITVTGTTTTDLVVNHTQNVYVYVRNATGATLTKGTVVYITGAIGQTPTISKAQANSDATSAQTLGVLTEDLANNTNGYITIIGLITDVNTSAYADGQQLYLSPTVAGGMTATKPQAPQHLVYVAIVEYAHAIHGKLFVKVQNGYELDELHDVQIISPTNGQTITYDEATNLWKNTTPTSGGVTSVTATSPVQSTGGTTPVISLPAATDSVSGYLTSTDHATFNAKQAALVSGTNIKTVNSNSLLGSGDVSVGTVTSVGGTGTVSGISLSGTVTSTGSLTLGGSLNLSSPPAIGGTTPNTITGTIVSATTQITLPGVTVGNVGFGVLQMFDGLDGYDYLHISTDDGSGTPQTVFFDDGINVAGGIVGGSITGTTYNVAGDGINSGALIIGEESNTYTVNLTVPTTLATNYNFVLPSTAGSANQVLKTDGSGNTSWVTPNAGTVTSVGGTGTVNGLTLTGTVTGSGNLTLGGTLSLVSPPAIGSTTPNTGAFTTLTTTGAVTTTAVTDPSAPSNGNLSIYAKQFGGYTTLAARNALNASFGLQSALWSKNIQMWTCTNSSAGAWINQTAASSGTFTAVTPTTGSTLYQTIRRSTYANVITTTNQVLGVNGTYLSFFRGSVAGQGGFFFYTRCGFDVWTNGGRFFAGLALNNTTIVSNDPSSNNNTVGFCVDAADNGAISFLTRGTAATKASTGYTITSNKGYDLYVYCSPNSSQYTWMIVDINAGTSATGTATNNLPTNTQTQQPTVLASNAALTPATSISLGIAKIYVESDY